MARARSCAAQLPQRGPQRRADVDLTVPGRRVRQLGLDRGDGLIGVAGLPAQVDQPGADLVPPGRGPRRGAARAGLLPAPLRDRFGFTARLDFYEPAELEVIVRRSADLLGVALRGDGAEEIARRSRGTPRIANRLLRRVRDYAEVRADGTVTRELARAALELYEVDEEGLDRLDLAVLSALVSRFGGGPVGLSTLAVAVGEEAETVEVVAEPFLVRGGLMARTPRGRVATPAAWQHLGLAPPEPPGLAMPGSLFE